MSAAQAAKPERTTSAQVQMRIGMSLYWVTISQSPSRQTKWFATWVQHGHARAIGPCESAVRALRLATDQAREIDAIPVGEQEIDIVLGALPPERDTEPVLPEFEDELEEASP